MISLAVRKFTRHDAAAIRRAVRAYMGKPVIVETGPLHHGTDALDDLHGDEIQAGYTLDLYVYERSTWCNDHGDLITNLDARWDGTMWTVVDPFNPTYTRSSTPTR